ncbi:uncharacterized protein [Palaemon carinicauda]|uniref:uncharacterized protein n=1 Tax=Palaemon carinicauda TaxID=392227 RepID=UPI0035B65A76
MDLGDLMDKAIKFGMDTAEAEEFIAKQQAREDRIAEREEKRIQSELAEKAKQQAREDRLAETEEKRFQLELAEKEKDRIFKLECLEREREQKEEVRKHELAKAVLRNRCAIGGVDSENVISSSKIPPFDEKIDEIDVYMNRFEKLAEFHKWGQEDYGTMLGTLLRGRALKVYCGLDPAIASNYHELKAALLKVFQVNPQVYRRKFREGYIETNESFVQYSYRSRQNFDKWLQLADVNKSYDDVCDFMIMDQLLANSSRDLRTFLFERVCKNSHEMALAADRYLIAHGITKCRNSKFKSDKCSKLGMQPKSDKVGADNIKTLQCHLCKEIGHIKPNCPNNPVNFAQSKSSNIPNISIALASEEKPKNAIVDEKGRVFNRTVEVLFDTGRNTVVLNETLIPTRYVGKDKTVKVYNFMGVPIYLPKIRCYLRSKFFSGRVNAIVAPIKCSDVIVGLIPGLKQHIQAGIELLSKIPVPDNEVDVNKLHVNVVTRKQCLRETTLKPLSDVLSEVEVNPVDFSNKQWTCDSLKSIRKSLKEE